MKIYSSTSRSFLLCCQHKVKLTNGVFLAHSEQFNLSSNIQCSYFWCISALPHDLVGWSRFRYSMYLVHANSDLSKYHYLLVFCKFLCLYNLRFWWIRLQKRVVHYYVLLHEWILLFCGNCLTDLKRKQCYHFSQTLSCHQRNEFHTLI